mgnify:CR=1 FL=1
MQIKKGAVVIPKNKLVCVGLVALVWIRICLCDPYPVSVLRFKT